MLCDFSGLKGHWKPSATMVRLTLVRLDGYLESLVATIFAVSRVLDHQTAGKMVARRRFDFRDAKVQTKRKQAKPEGHAVSDKS